jgi:hypothetical protein
MSVQAKAAVKSWWQLSQTLRQQQRCTQQLINYKHAQTTTTAAGMGNLYDSKQIELVTCTGEGE